MISMRNVEMDWKEFERAIRILARNIKKSKMQYSVIYGIPRGGLIVAVRLSHLLKIPYWNYQMSFSEKENFFMNRILIVDDIADTGKTLLSYSLLGYSIATLYWNPDSCTQPKFWVKRKSSKEWVIFPWEAK